MSKLDNRWILIFNYSNEFSWNFSFSIFFQFFKGRKYVMRCLSLEQWIYSNPKCIITKKTNIKHTFDHQNRKAVESNVLPTLHLTTLAKKMQKLESFVYVSTAYTNCDRLDGKILEEKIYESAVEPRKVIESIR